MDFLYDVFPLILYLLGAVLLVVVIMMTCKLIKTVDKVNVLLDDIEGKSQSLNGLFRAIERLGNLLDNVNSKTTGFVSGMVKKVFKSRKKEKSRTRGGRR